MLLPKVFNQSTLITLTIDQSQKLFMYSMTPGQDSENEAKPGNFASSIWQLK